jgi:hypothetical protein
MQIFSDVTFSDHPKKDLALTGDRLYNLLVVQKCANSRDLGITKVAPNL